MNRTWIRGGLATLAMGLALTACKKNANDQTQTSSQGGMTASSSRRGNHRGAGAGDTSSQPSEKGASKGGMFARHDYTIPSGTSLIAMNEQTVSSRSSQVGARVTARVNSTLFSATGDTVIPYGALLVGRVTQIHPAPHPGQQGTLQLKFDSLEMGSSEVPIALKIDSVKTSMRGRGVTTTDAAKVGAGAVIGGIAGRILGHNSKGTIIGAVAGGAAGAVVAHNTRTVDVVLPAGSAIHLELTSGFDRNHAIASAQ